MARNRPKITGENMTDWFAPTGGRKKAPSEKKYPLHAYRILNETHAHLKEIAAKEGVGLSDLVRYIFREFINQWEAGEITLPIEHYVTTNSRLTTD